MSETIDLTLVQQGDALLAEAYRLAGDNAATLATRQAQWLASDLLEKDIAMEITPQRGRPRQAPTVAVSVRMTTDLLARVDTYIDTLAARIPGLRLERSRGICLMLERLLELDASLAQPEPAPTAQPAIPLAAEPAPAAEVQPDTRQPIEHARTRKTSSSRRKDGKGGNPGISDETLQQIADERTQCEGLSLGEFAQRLFDKNIYRTTSNEGTTAPVHRGTLQKWLERARQKGML